VLASDPSATLALEYDKIHTGTTIEEANRALNGFGLQPYKFKHLSTPPMYDLAYRKEPTWLFDGVLIKLSFDTDNRLYEKKQVRLQSKLKIWISNLGA
jgi:hypothetical protein